MPRSIFCSYLKREADGLDRIPYRPELTYQDIRLFDAAPPPLPDDIARQVEIQVKYQGYIDRQYQQVAQFKKLESIIMPPDLPYAEMKGLSREVREKLIKVDPALELKLPSEPDVEPKPISAATFAKLVKTATTMGEFWEQARNVALLYCLRDTGGRIGGLLNARLDDLDLKAGLLTVCEKGNRMRDMPLNDPVRAALRQWLKARALLDPETDHLFIGLHGRSLTRNSTI